MNTKPYAPILLFAVAMHYFYLATKLPPFQQFGFNVIIAIGLGLCGQLILNQKEKDQ